MSEKIIQFPDPEEFQAKKEAKWLTGVIGNPMPREYWGKYFIREGEEGWAVTVVEEGGIGRYVSGMTKADAERHAKKLELSGYRQTFWHGTSGN